MSATKIAILVGYAILGALALTQSGSPAGVWSAKILLILVVAHAVEVIVFFKACRRAGGSLVGHLFNVLLFGVFHMKEIKAAQSAG
jgi:uncharacterized protein YhhL (DUF1145 family)